MENKKDEKDDDSLIFGQFVTNTSNITYLLKLYVSGTSPQSVRAINNIKKICEENLKGRYTLEVIDLYQHPELAKEANLIAAPTLVKNLPLPFRRIIGDMSNTDRVLVALDLKKN
jgi:circadian clock protein KaiB